MKYYNVMLTGTNKDPNTCQICNKNFSRASELAIHYQQRHPELYREKKRINLLHYYYKKMNFDITKNFLSLLDNLY